MGSGLHDEIERTFDVDGSAVLPDLAGFGGVSSTSRPAELLLEARYVDTPDLDLARHGVTLRRRTGGHDAGWHLKLPRGKDTRTEVHAPLGDDADHVPDELVARVRGLIRGRDLVPVALVVNRRWEHSLLDGEGVVLAQVCDDHVHTERLHGEALTQDWREWEVELVDGDRDLLDQVGQELLDSGAVPARTSSKLARSLGDLVPAVPTRPSTKTLASGSAGQAVEAYLIAHVAELLRQDGQLRTDGHDAVHQLRIATRRLRSALVTYRPLLETGSVDGIGDELRWLGQSLADARDAQVLRERLHDLVSAEPSELVLGPVMGRIDDELRAAERTGLEQASETLDSERYLRLLDSLDQLVAAVPLTAVAGRPVRDELPRLLHRDAKRLRRAVAAIGRSAGGPEHDAALHDARKKAKRLRYAAESAVPVLGKPAARLAASVKKMQQALGEHQDSVVSRERLREYGVRAHGNGENGFTFGRLHALEQSRGDAAERVFEAAWTGRHGKTVRRW
jgi:CHAD domain-containing protein